MLQNRETPHLSATNAVAAQAQAAQSTPDRSEGDVNHGAARQEWQARELDAATRELLAEDARWFFQQSMSSPCLNVLDGAAGAWLRDRQGRRILDCHGNSLHQLGHGHPAVREAIEQALAQLPFCPRRYTHEAAVRFARRLCQAAPIAEAKLLLAPSGTAAIGMALKLARWVTGRFKTLSMWDAFHGASLDAISIGGEAAFRRGIGPLLPGAEHVPPYDPAHCVFGCAGRCALRCADYVDYCLQREGDVAAVIVETIRSTDVQIPPPEYFQRIRQACDRHGALLILDEIPIALGRTGALFAVEPYAIEPDMIVLGKGLGGGVMPLAALIARAEFDTAQEISLGHYTHEKSPVACAAGLAVLDVLEQERLPERARTLGAEIFEELQAWRMDQPAVAEVRVAGLLIAVELRDHAGHSAESLAEAVLYRCLSAGLSFKVGQGRVLVLAPPLNIEAADLDWAIATLRQTVEEVCGA